MAKLYNIKIEEKWCKGCGLCIAICKKNVLELNEQSKCFVLSQDNCIGCRQCDYICPDMAVTVKEREQLV